jgi:hypothetical protein
VLGEQASEAFRSLRKSFEQWVTIGRFVVEVRKIADARGGRNTFMRILEQRGFSEPQKMKTVFSKLERMMTKEAEATDWHRRLPVKQQVEWASPSSVLRRCPAFADPTKPKRVRSQPARAPATPNKQRAHHGAAIGAHHRARAGA